jgi:hypothetical protein
MEEYSIDQTTIGSYLVNAGFITDKQLDKALAIQADLPFLRIGEILMGLRSISIEALIQALYHQFSQAMLGNILVRQGQVTQEALESALTLQKEARGARRLGDILKELGLVTDDQINAALAMQDSFQDYKYRLLVNQHFREQDTLSDLLPTKTMPWNRTDDALISFEKYLRETGT